MNIVIS